MSFTPRVTIPQFAFLLTLLCTLECPATDETAPAKTVSAANANSALQTKSPTHIWGTVYRGELISHTFVLKNDTEKAVVIKGISPSCSCTVVRGVKAGQKIEAGSTLQLPVDLATGELLGRQAKSVEVYYDDEPRPVRVIMSGRVKPLLKFQPRDIATEVVCGASVPPKDAQFRVSPVVGTQLTLHSVRLKRELVKATHKQVDNKTVLLTVSPIVRAGDMPGPDGDTLIAELDIDGKHRVLHLPVTVLRRARIGFTGRKSVLFRRKMTRKIAQGKGPIERHLDLKSVGGPEHRFRILNVESPKKFFVVKTQEIAPGQHYRISILMDRIPKVSKTKALRDVIQIKTDDELVPLLKIPVRAQF